MVPTATDVEKYSSVGGFSFGTFELLGLPEMVVDPLVEAGNQSYIAQCCTVHNFAHCMILYIVWISI